jgi:hypothetical protein
MGDLEVPICECGHWENDHHGECFDCKWQWDKYGKINEIGQSKCSHFNPMYTAQLGKIESVTFGIEDHGCMNIRMCFDFGGSGQCYDMGILDTYDKKKEHRVGTAYGLDLIRQLLNYFGVDKLDDIVGKLAYAIRDKEVNPMIRGVKRNPVEENGKHDNVTFFSNKKIFKEWEHEVGKEDD